MISVCKAVLKRPMLARPAMRFSDAEAREKGLSYLLPKTYLCLGVSATTSLACANFVSLYMPGYSWLVVGGLMGYLSLAYTFDISPTY
jgi:hypothetical protein